MKALTIFVLSCLFLAACQPNATVRENAGGRFQSLEGATLVLKEPLQVAPGNARVFIQNGQATNKNNSLVRGSFDQYQPHCAFEIESVDHNGFTIQPATFRITRVQGALTQVVMVQPVQVAGLRLAHGLYGRGASAYHEGYHFWLASESQPGVRRMTCYGVFAEPPDLYPPTLQEIRQALGAIAEIRRSADMLVM